MAYRYSILLQQNGVENDFIFNISALKKVRKYAIGHLKDCKCKPLRQVGSIYSKFMHDEIFVSLVHPAFGQDASVTIKRIILK